MPPKRWSPKPPVVEANQPLLIPPSIREAIAATKERYCKPKGTNVRRKNRENKISTANPDYGTVAGAQQLAFFEGAPPGTRPRKFGGRWYRVTDDKVILGTRYTPPQTLLIQTSGKRRFVIHETGTGTDKQTFRYEVTPGDTLKAWKREVIKRIPFSYKVWGSYLHENYLPLRLGDNKISGGWRYRIFKYNTGQEQENKQRSYVRYVRKIGEKTIEIRVEDIITNDGVSTVIGPGERKLIISDGVLSLR